MKKRRNKSGKAELPTKLCKVCGRPFSWRRKWKAVWDEVHYCSKRCRGRRNLKAVDMN